MQKAALISVSDRTNLIELAQGLSELGYVILGTKGTKTYLEENNIKTASIEEYTGQVEILGGRVKTLHPKIHAGILARREIASDLQELDKNSIYQIDLVCVNLYPFEEGLQAVPKKSIEQMIELIDIGGPTMIRAAAKNCASVYAVVDPADYKSVLNILNKQNDSKEEALKFRRRLASKVFTRIATYDLEIAKYLTSQVCEAEPQEQQGLASTSGWVLKKSQSLRYGENPHQVGAFYRTSSNQNPAWKQLQGKELSYNNFLDFDAAFRIVKTLDPSKPAVVIVKHLNPCGAAISDNLLNALELAKRSDPRSHFGGIIACNQVVDENFAGGVIEDFAEIVVAPGFTDTAKKIFAERKNLRLVEIISDYQPQIEMRSVADGFLIQTQDVHIASVKNARTMTSLKPTAQQLEDLDLAWTLCAHVKSNAITIVKDGILLATGAGQMSRIDSAELALNKAKIHGHDLNGAVAASDAFFPFPDTPEQLANAGIKAIVAPSGAKKDQAVIDACDKLGITLLFASERHFRH